MIATWMAYCIGISTVLGLTALAVEQVLHERRQPRRWIWTAAILVSAVWAFAPWVLPATPARENASVDTTALISPAWAWIETLNGPLLFAWLVLSLGSLLGIGLLQARAQRRCRRWRPMRVDDVDALVSKDVGPAVIGLLRGRIVVPEWVLTLDAGDRRRPA